jgi:TorA maturation chaperone TorD
MSLPLAPAGADSSALDEETARAEVYGLLAAACTTHRPRPSCWPSCAWPVTEAPAAGGFLEEPWRALVGSARALSDEAIQTEYDDLFGGVGKPEVFLYGSHYLSGFLNEKPLVQAAHDLAALGLARDEAMSETEDHFACLCEVMRYLIAGDDVAVANLARQQAFFARHIQPWAGEMCDAIAAHPKARFNADLAGFTRAFLSVEAQGFDLLDS